MHFTGNDIESNDILDFEDNCENLDVLVNADQDYWTDRFGNKRPTIDYALRMAGFTPAGFDFATGGVLKNGDRNKCVFNQADQTWYSWSGELPYNVIAGSTPGEGWKVVNRNALIIAKEALRRTYLEVGLNLVEGSFEAGAVITSTTDVVLHEKTGKCYSGPIGEVPKGTNPLSGGFVDKGGNLASDEINVLTIKGINFDLEIDNRSLLFSLTDKIFIPKDVTIRCNFLPDDDVTKFTGSGKIYTRSPWGTEHIFDISKMYSSTTQPDASRIFKVAQTREWCRIGIIGDSITDGADSSGWLPNPTDSSGNLSSTNYNHTFNGGNNSWFSTFVANMNFLLDPKYTDETALLRPYNISSSGKKISDGWGYRNFDYGFFQNQSYGKRAPDVFYIALGYNDLSYLNTEIKILDYLDKIDKLIKKAKGYGCSVGVVTLNTNDNGRKFIEKAIKETIAKVNNIAYYDLSTYLDKYRRSHFETPSSMWEDPDKTFDTTHPKTNTHRFLGAAMTHCLAKELIINAKPGVNHTPLTETDFRNLTFPSKLIKSVSQYKLSGGYLDGLDGWALVKPNENITFTYPVWCEDKDISCVVFEPFHPDYTVQSFNNNLKNRLNARVDDGNTYTLASSKFPNHTKWLTSRIGNLQYGLNWIEVVYDGAPSRIYPPALLFRKSNLSFTVGSLVRFLQPGKTYPLNLFGGVKKLLDSDFQLTDGSDIVVDENNSDNFDTLGSFKIECQAGVVLTLCSKFGEGIEIKKISATEITIGLTGQPVLVTLTSVFTKGYTVIINHLPLNGKTGITVSIYNDNLEAVGSRDIEPLNGAGGRLEITNTGSSTTPVIVSGGMGYQS